VANLEDELYNAVEEAFGGSASPSTSADASSALYSGSDWNTWEAIYGDTADSRAEFKKWQNIENVIESEYGGSSELYFMLHPDEYLEGIEIGLNGVGSMLSDLFDALDDSGGGSSSSGSSGGAHYDDSLTNSGTGGTWTRDAQLLYDWMDDGYELLDITIYWENNETTSFGGHNGKWRIISRTGDRRDTGFNYSLSGSTFYLDPTTADVHYVLSGGGNGSFTNVSGGVEYFTWEAWVPGLQSLDETLAAYGFAVSDSYNDYYTGGYVIPHSNARLLTDSDLYGLTDWELMLARNEIYARHGRKFQMSEFQNYFDAQSWYYGMYEPAEFDANANTLLSDTERRNIAIIKEYEDAH
jgi:hypothetical protein